MSKVYGARLKVVFMNLPKIQDLAAWTNVSRGLAWISTLRHLPEFLLWTFIYRYRFVM